MRFAYDPDIHAAGIRLTGDPDAHTVDLGRAVYADVAPDGTLCGVEVLDTRQWGTTFDRAVAERVVAWVREQLANAAA